MQPTFVVQDLRRDDSDNDRVTAIPLNTSEISNKRYHHRYGYELSASLLHWYLVRQTSWCQRDPAPPLTHLTADSCFATDLR